MYNKILRWKWHLQFYFSILLILLKVPVLLLNKNLDKIFTVNKCMV